MDFIERLEFEEHKTNTKFVTAINGIYVPFERNVNEIDRDAIGQIHDKLINFKYENKVHLVYAVSRIFAVVGKNSILAKIMADICRNLCEPEAEYRQKYNLKEILKDQINKEINFIDKIKGYYRQFEETASILKKNQYTNQSLYKYVFNVILLINQLFYVQCNIVSPKMICNILDKLYYITDLKEALQGFLEIITLNWDKLEWTYRFYLHRYFRLIERLIKNNKIQIQFNENILKQRNIKWLAKNDTPSNFENKMIIFQEDWTMQFKQTARNFFNARKTDCLACDQLIKTDDKKQLLKHYSQKSHMQKLQDQLIALYNSKRECAICATSDTATDHRSCDHEQIVKNTVCLSCFLCYREPQYLDSHFKTRAHIYESLSLYDDQKSEALKIQLIIREARKFDIHPKHKPKHVTSTDITQSIDELEKKRYGTNKELSDFLQELSSKVEAEMNKLIKNMRNKGHRKVPENCRLLVEYREETIKVEDVYYMCATSGLRPFYKSKKYSKDTLIKRIKNLQPVPDKSKDGGPFSASEDEDEKWSTKLSPLSSPATSEQFVTSPKVIAAIPKQKSPADLTKSKDVSHIPLVPPSYTLPPSYESLSPAPQSPTASAQLVEFKLATPTKAYSRKRKSFEGSAPVSPRSFGSTSEKGSPKPPSILSAPSAYADDQPPPSKGAVPKKKAAELTLSKKSITFKDFAPVSPSSDGSLLEKDSTKLPSISVESLSHARGSIPQKKAANLTSPKKSKASRDVLPTSPADSCGRDIPGALDGYSSGDEDLLPNGHINLQAKKKKSFKRITDLINQKKGKNPENIVLAKKLEFFLNKLYFSDFIPLDAMTACIDHFIEKLESEDS